MNIKSEVIEFNNVTITDAKETGSCISFYTIFGKLKKERCFEIVDYEKSIFGAFVIATSGDYYLMYSIHHGTVNISKRRKKCTLKDFWNDIRHDDCEYYYVNDCASFNKKINISRLS